ASLLSQKHSPKPSNRPHLPIPLNNCGGNCPSGDCSECYCGTSPHYVDAASYCAQYSDWSHVRRFFCFFCLPLFFLIDSTQGMLCLHRKRGEWRKRQRGKPQLKRQHGHWAVSNQLVQLGRVLGR